MRLGLLFPDVESFRPGMAVETYEHYAVVRRGYEELDSVVSRGLTRRVLYPARRDTGLAAHERRAAVLTASVGLYCLYRQTFPVPGHVLVGKGVGVLAALVAAGAVTLREALRLATRRGSVRPRRVARPVVSVADYRPRRHPRELAELIQALAFEQDWPRATAAERLASMRLDALLEIGPGDTGITALASARPETLLLGALDRHGNQARVTDILNERKLFNPDHLAHRVLGILAGTPDRLDQPDSRQRLRELFTAIRRTREHFGGPVSNWRTPEVWAVLRRLSAMITTCFDLKGVPQEERDRLLHHLEGDTLLPVRSLAGLRPEVVDASSRGAVREEKEHAFA